MAKSKVQVAGVLGLDPTLPDVSLVVGDTTYRLAFDFNACALVQAQTGINVFAQSGSEDFNPLHFRAMFWAALVKDQPEMTINDAGALITPKTLPAIAAAVHQTWAASQAEPVEGNE